MATPTSVRLSLPPRFFLLRGGAGAGAAAALAAFRNSDRNPADF